MSFTPEAQQRLDHYLRQVHAAMSGCRSLSAQEVERDIRDHLAREFDARTAPVELADLESVLERLGSPSQWVPVEELAWWRRLLLRLRTGPGDWRLAAISLGLLVVGLMFIPLTWPFIVASFLVARAAVAAAAERGEELGAQKWLVYPPLVLISAGLFLLVGVGPIACAGALAHNLRQDIDSGAFQRAWRREPPDLSFMPQDEVGFTLTAVLAAAALWFLVLGSIAAIWPGLIRALLRPFADNFQRWHALGLTVLIAGLLVLAWFIVRASVES
jgi:hypothetical protein